MDILKKEFLHEQTINSLSLYSKNSLEHMMMLAHMRVLQAPIIESVFKKISKDKKPNEDELEKYNNCNKFEERMFYFSIINQCSMFDAFLTDIETILILLEHKGKLTSITTSPEEISKLEPQKIILKGARDLAKKNSFDGIKSRLSKIYSNYKLKNRPRISLFESCEEIFRERHYLVHAPFSFTETSEKEEWDAFADNDGILRQVEATLGETAYKLSSQVLEQKFGDLDQPMLILIKQMYMEPDELANEYNRIFGDDSVEANDLSD